MKKINCLIVLVSAIFLFSPLIEAKTTTNGVKINNNESENDNTFSLYCAYYNGDYVLINRESSDDKGNVEPDNMPFHTAGNPTLKQFHFMKSDNTLDCPLYIYGVPSPNGGKLQTIKGFSNENQGNLPVFSDYIFVQLNTGASECSGKCDGSQSSNQDDFWSCTYTGPSGTLTTKYDGKYYAYYPDSSWAIVNSNAVSPFCPDVFWNKETNQMKQAEYDYAEYIRNHNNFDPTQYGYLCGADKDKWEYYCSGTCKYPNNANIDCTEINKIIESGNNSPVANPLCEKEFGKFLKQIFQIIKILVPIIIIGLAVVDFVKAMAAQKQDEVKNAFNKLVKRLIIGAIIFVLPTLIDVLLEIAGITSNTCGW